jgi:hypothetical protein
MSPVNKCKNYTNMWACCQTHMLNLMRGSFFQVSTFTRLTAGKGRIATAVTKCTTHNHVHLPLLISVEATRVCMPTGNSNITCSCL